MAASCEDVFAGFAKRFPAMNTGAPSYYPKTGFANDEKYEMRTNFSDILISYHWQRVEIMQLQ